MAAANSTDTNSGPLTGIVVLDLSNILSGPYCTMLLADLGAEVIKVERPKIGDQSRRLGPQVDGDSAYFMSVNRGKKSITIDLSSKTGQELVRNLSKRADVLVENFVPGTMKEFELDYSNLNRVNSRLIYTSISGFGQDGPYAHRPAFDIIVQAMGGMMSVTGEPGGHPIRPGASLGDSVAGIFATVAILAALWERERTGRGQYLDVSMLDCQVTLMENAFSRFFATGKVPGPIGSRHPAAVPFQAFPTRDGYIVVAIISDDTTLWSRFCAAINRPELTNDPRFSDPMTRVNNYQPLEEIIENALRQRSSNEWLDKFSKLEIPCGPVNGVDAVTRDPQILYRRMIAEISHKRLGTWRVANTPFRFDRTPSKPHGPSPDLGEHTESILHQFLKLSSAEISRLKSEGTI
jgi:CoA:oxalate CoA-transferase